MNNKLAIITSLCFLAQSPVWGAESGKSNQPTNDPGSFYGSLAGGVAFFQDSRVTVQVKPSGAADFDFDSGTSIALRLGYDFGGFRLEGELNHSQADIRSLDTDTGLVPVDSEYLDYGFMANVLWDFEFDSFVLSAGGGIGIVKGEYDQIGEPGFIAVAASEDTVFAKQLILRGGYRVNEMTTLGLNYRYFMTSDMSDKGFVDTGVGGESNIDFDATRASIFELFVSRRF